MSKTTNMPETITTQDTGINTTQSSSIDFEQDQREDLDSVNEAKSLSDQVVKLRNFRRRFGFKRKRVKRTQKKSRTNVRGGYSYHDAGNEYLYFKTR